MARAALEGGATWLAVALVEEGVTLREAGIERPDPPAVRAARGGDGRAVARRLVPTVYTAEGIGGPGQGGGATAGPRR